eukprot:scaffold8194_cov248-Pinguiococcus_pyrenoidosus.AAC.5
MAPADVAAFLSSSEGDKTYVYVDVRTPKEFEETHVAGAVNIPAFTVGAGGMQANEDFVDEVKSAFPETGSQFARKEEKEMGGNGSLHLARVLDAQEMFVGCKSGGRSSKACEKLKEEGYTVYNVSGGMQARWKDRLDLAADLLAKDYFVKKMKSYGPPLDCLALAPLATRTAPSSTM